MKRKSLLFLLLFALIAPWAANAQQILTVHDGTTTNSNVPVYGYWADAYQKCEMVYPAAELSDMAGGTITSMLFYSSNANVSWGAGVFQVFLAEVANTTISSFAGPGTVVYEGSLSISGNQMNVVFSTPYNYGGGNLLVGVYETTTGTWSSCNWYGESVTGASIQGYNSSSLNSVSASQKNFLPKTTFSYLTTDPYVVLSPATATVLTGSTQTLTASYGNVTDPTITYTSSDDNVATVIGTGTTATVTAVAEGTATITATMNGSYTSTCTITVFDACQPTWTGNSYYISNVTISSSEETLLNNASTGTGGTTTNYYNTTSLTANAGDALSCVVTMSASSTYGFALWVDFDGDGLDDGDLIESTSSYQSSPYTLTLNIPDDTPSGEYRMRVWGDFLKSSASDPCGSFSNGEAEDYKLIVVASYCKRPTNLATTEIGKRAVTLDWTENGEATEWEVEITDLDGGQVTTWPAPAKPFEIVGLTPATRYSVRVKPVCDVEKWSDALRFVTLEACPAPNLTVTGTTPTTATLSWDGSAESYEMEYAIPGGAKVASSFDFEDGTLQGWTNLIVNSDGGQWLHSNDQPTGYDYTELAHGGTGFALCFSYVDPTDEKYESGAYPTNAYLVSPQSYVIGAGASMTFWYDMANESYPEYFEVCVATAANPTAADFTPIWSYDSAKGHKASEAKVRRSNTRYENWQEINIDLSAYAGQMVWIAFHDNNEDADMYEVWIDDVTIDPGTGGDITWIPVGHPVTSPYTLNPPLTEQTSYLVRVRAYCGEEDGYSDWVIVSFTTPGYCDAPNNLNVPYATLMPESATLAWTGYQGNYQMRYRTPASSGAAPGSLFDDFENGLGNWTTIVNAEGLGWRTFDATAFQNGSNYSGNYVAMARSYENGVDITADNWMITAQPMTIPSTMTYWAKNDGRADHLYDETYDVCVSTTTNSTSDFVVVQTFTTAPNEWGQITIDLSAYEGQQGYIAFHHHDAEKDMILIDDVLIGTMVDVPAGDWIYVTTEEEFAEIASLSPETAYEWQVRGYYEGCTNGEDANYTAWSEIDTFETPGYCDNPNHMTIVDNTTGTSTTVSWTGYQESYNVVYFTAAVEEFLYEDFSEGLDGWMFANLNSQSNTYTLVGEDDDETPVFGFYGDGNAQTLVSPKMEGVVNGTILKFLYYDFSQGAVPQTFNIGFTSDEELEYLSQITFGDTPHTTTTEDYIDYYEIEVPAGTTRFAIQSSGAAGTNSYLFITDVLVYGPNYQPAGAGGYWELTTETNSATLEHLTPETEYEVWVQGVCDEDHQTYWLGSSFWTPEQTVITQPIELAAGTTWVSFYVNTNMDALKAALEPIGGSQSNPIIIQGKGGQTTYNGTRWRGALSTLDFGQMYKITVPTSAEISLEGMPLDPSQIEITMKHGANWIGFPFQQSMAVADAFANSAISGDLIRTKSGGQANYNGTRWRGALSTLVPGVGYIYESADDEKPFVYPTGSSKAASHNETSTIVTRNMKTLSFDRSVNLPSSNVKSVKKAVEETKANLNNSLLK